MTRSPDLGRLSGAIILFLFAASGALAAPPASEAARVAKLVHEADIATKLDAALRSPDALVRATAARVAGVRDEKSALPALREIAPTETDESALREEIRTLALIGTAADVDVAIAAASKRSSAFDAVVADAVARRGGEEAMDLYMAKVRNLRETPGFFARALWGHEDQISPIAGWLLSSRVAKGWEQFLDAMFTANKAVPYARMIAAIENGSEDIREESLWYLVRGYANDPMQLHEELRKRLLAPRAEEGSDREDYARELLRRMLGEKPSSPERWLRWLASEEADRTLPYSTEMYAWLTPEELELREVRCKGMSRLCPMPAKRGTDRKFPSAPVARAPFALPGTLPAGLAEQLLRSQSCQWLGVASASVDHAGRVQSLDLKNVSGPCNDALATMMKLSYATNATLASETTAANLLLVKNAAARVCLDELPDDAEGPYRAGGDVTAPVARRRVEPRFPASARHSMGKDGSVLVIAELVVTRTGCVRSVSLLAQSQWPELNGAAVLALSQWEFEPGRRNGRPVDVVFVLTMNFKTK